MEEKERASRHPYRRESVLPKARFIKVRNVLNLIFMIGAIIGIIIYFLSNETIGIIVILAAMVFKLIECALRFIH